MSGENVELSLAEQANNLYDEADKENGVNETGPMASESAGEEEVGDEGSSLNVGDIFGREEVAAALDSVDEKVINDKEKGVLSKYWGDVPGALNIPLPGIIGRFARAVIVTVLVFAVKFLVRLLSRIGREDESDTEKPSDKKPQSPKPRKDERPVVKPVKKVEQPSNAMAAYLEGKS